jgi:hypothetical protein
VIVTPGAATGVERSDTVWPFNVNSVEGHPDGKEFVKLTVRLYTRIGTFSEFEKVRGRFGEVEVTG